MWSSIKGVCGHSDTEEDEIKALRPYCIPIEAWKCLDKEGCVLVNKILMTRKMYDE